MDNTGKLFNTGHTADETYLYPSSVGGRPSQPFYGSRTLSNPLIQGPTIQPSLSRPLLQPPSVMQPSLSGPVGPTMPMAPMAGRPAAPNLMPMPPLGPTALPMPIGLPAPGSMPRPAMTRPAPSVIPIGARMPPVVTVSPIRIDDQVQVYCPVCKRGYSNFQVETHAQMHDSTAFYQFGKSDLSTSGASTPGATQYPMIQPMQFWTNQLTDSHKDDIYIFRDNKNYDKVNPSVLRGPKLESFTQTFYKPPLQYQSNETDCYNCFDNAVNSKKGPKFSFSDICGHNQFIRPKRQLDDWEYMQKADHQQAITIPFGPWKQ